MSAPDKTKPAAPPAPLFKPFTWLSDATIAASPRRPAVPSRRVLDLVADTQDITRGIGLLLQLLESDSLCKDSVDIDGVEVRPILGAVNQASLLRLAIVSLGMLEVRAEDELTLTGWQTVDDVAEGVAE